LHGFNDFLRFGDLRFGDLRVDDLRVDDLRFGDLRVDDLRVDDLRVDDLRFSKIFCPNLPVFNTHLPVLGFTTLSDGQGMFLYIKNI